MWVVISHNLSPSALSSCRGLGSNTLDFGTIAPFNPALSAAVRIRTALREARAGVVPKRPIRRMTNGLAGSCLALVLRDPAQQAVRDIGRSAQRRAASWIWRNPR